jgi:hypothetical protein
LTTIDWFEGGVINVVSLLQAIIVGSPFFSKISIFLFELLNPQALARWQ